MNTDEADQNQGSRRLHGALAIITLSTVPLYVLGLALLALAPTLPATAATHPSGDTPAVGHASGPSREAVATAPDPAVPAAPLGSDLPQSPAQAEPGGASRDAMNDAAAIASGSWLQEVLANANHGTDGMGTDAGKLAKVGKGKDRGRGRGKH